MFNSKSSEGVAVNLLFAMIVMQGLITGFFEHALKIKSSANLAVLLLWTVTFVWGIFRKEQYQVCTSSIIWCLYIICIYFVSKYIWRSSQFYPMLIIFYAFIPMIISCQKINAEKVLRYALYISCLSIFYLKELFALQYEGYNQASMGNSYSVVTGLIAFFIHFSYYRKESDIHIKLVYIYNVFLLFRLLLTGNRGAILSLIICGIVLILNKQTMIKRQIILIIVCTIAIVSYLNINNILKIIFPFINKIGIQMPSFILKTTDLIGESSRGIDNGRNVLYQTLFGYINKNPIVGYGIGSIPTYTNYPWAHNYLLQFWFEGGIILLLIAVIVFAWYLIFLIGNKKERKEELIIAILVFCECVPRYLISNDPWRGTAVWLMMGYGTIKVFKAFKIKNKIYKVVVRGK